MYIVTSYWISGEGMHGEITKTQKFDNPETAEHCNVKNLKDTLCTYSSVARYYQSPEYLQKEPKRAKGDCAYCND